jgi:hypothetical protein
MAAAAASVSTHSREPPNHMAGSTCSAKAPAGVQAHTAHVAREGHLLRAHQSPRPPWQRSVAAARTCGQRLQAHHQHGRDAREAQLRRRHPGPPNGHDVQAAPEAGGAQQQQLPQWQQPQAGSGAQQAQPQRREQRVCVAAVCTPACAGTAGASTGHKVDGRAQRRSTVHEGSQRGAPWARLPCTAATSTSRGTASLLAALPPAHKEAALRSHLYISR